MSRCSSCGASIVWVRTRAGKNMPCDLGLVDIRPEDVNVADDVLVGIDTAGDVVRGVATTRDEATAQIRISHFATCANAARHRTSRTKAGPDG